MRYRGPKGKIARRLGVAITPKCVKILERRPNPPGQHGASRRRAVSNFGLQLLEKQKLKFQYMINERSLRRYYDRAVTMTGVAGTNLLRLLDERLDATLVRSGLVPTILAARQLVNHRHVFINGKRVNKPSHVVGPSDVVTLGEKAKKMTFIEEFKKSGLNAPYIELNRESLTIKRTRQPERIEIPVICEEQMIVEHYSR